MTMINMLRGGKANGPDGRTYTQNMYPRPNYKVSQMAKNDGWENRPDSFHYVERFDLCQCWNSGAVERAKAEDTTTDECTIEAGDVIPLVWVPNRSSVESLTLDVVSGVEGIVLGIQTRHFFWDQNINDIPDAVALQMTGVPADPMVGGPDPIDQEYLDSFKCGNRIPLDEFCGCDGRGEYREMWLSANDDGIPRPVLVGGGNKINAGYIVDLLIEAVPTDLDCANACLIVDVGARVRVPHAGN